MFVQPGIQVKPVEHTTPTQANGRYIQLVEQGDPDPQVDGRLFLGQTANGRQRQARLFHGQPLDCRSYSLRTKGSGGSAGFGFIRVLYSRLSASTFSRKN